MKRFLLPCLATFLPGSLLAAGPVDYSRDVRPILTEHCNACHGAKKQRGSLRLDSAQALRLGGNSGPAVVPGKSGASRLILAVSGGNDDIAVMPPKGTRLSTSEIDLLRKWIDEGAKVPAGESAASTPRQSNTSVNHWAFQPIQRPPLPAVLAAHWCRNGIDRFVVARLEKAGIAPSPEADRITLLRRVSLDLIGLPPSPKDIDDFSRDKRPDAYERVVERLLASPHYGERWGRHWLDLARYADSNGYSIDSPRSIWKYRDWVLAALNDDKPFDRFVVEQLAGDLLPNATNETRIATGFHRNTQINEEGGIDQEQFRIESIVDRANTTGTVFLGLTVGCCQCHDHKFDPLSQREYYQLFAFFNNCDEPTLELPTPEQERKRREIRTRLAAVEKELRALDTATPERVAKWEGGLTPEVRSTLPAKLQAILAIAPNGRNARQEQAVIAAYRNAEQVRHVVGGLGQPLNYLASAHVAAMLGRKKLEKQIAELRKELPFVPTTLVLQERKTPRLTNILLGGDFLRKGATVTPDVPRILPPLAKKNRPTRLDLARWLVDGRNPLTARVTVNRIWQQYFGLGIVETENDFGTQGTPPSHPELLDWLADEFVSCGWSMKSLHRLMVSSNAYRMSSRANDKALSADPINDLFWRFDMRRLTAEEVRDSILTLSGTLNPKMYGPGVFTAIPAEVMAGQSMPGHGWGKSPFEEQCRRSIYVHVKRSLLTPILESFDAAETDRSTPVRFITTQPTQALSLLNGDFVHRQAKLFADRLRREAGTDVEKQVRLALELATTRRPTEGEIRRGIELIDALKTKDGIDSEKALTYFCLVVLNMNEFVYLD